MSRSLLAYLALVAAVGAERLLEVAISRRNLARLRARGGVVVERASLAASVTIQSAWLAACALEVTALRRPFLPLLAAPMLALLAGAMALRYASAAALGDRWTLAIAAVPGEPPVTAGPYRYVRHPNYLAVIVEAYALPLAHSAWITAATLGTAIVALAFHRIRVEEAALAGGGAYSRAFAATPRLLP